MSRSSTERQRKGWGLNHRAAAAAAAATACWQGRPTATKSRWPTGRQRCNMKSKERLKSWKQASLTRACDCTGWWAYRFRDDRVWNRQAQMDQPYKYFTHIIKLIYQSQISGQCWQQEWWAKRNKVSSSKNALCR